MSLISWFPAWAGLWVNIGEGWLHRPTKVRALVLLGHSQGPSYHKNWTNATTSTLDNKLTSPRVMGLVVGGCTATQHWSAALPALQSCYQPRGEKLEMKGPRGSAWDEELPWKGSLTHRETPSTFWGTRAAAAYGDNADSPSKVCFKTPSSSSWQSSNTPENLFNRDKASQLSHPLQTKSRALVCH